MIHLWAENNSKHGVGDYCRPFGLVLQLLVTWIKRTHLTRLLTPHFKVQFLFRVAGQSRNNISFKFWHSLFLKKEKKKGGQFYDHSLQNDMLLSLPHPPLVCQYIYPSFLLPSFFAFGRKRQETWNISPFFFHLWQGLWRRVGERRCAIFLQPPTNKI